MIPLLLTFTLFPYTTLFRSVRCGLVGLSPALSLAILCVHHATSATRSNGILDVQSGHSAGCHMAKSCRTIPSDRKSTRLNSSHLGISYAVFCLKKKNNKS